jgi:hypothetical protein
VVTDGSKQPPRWLLKWESLDGQVQILIAFPVLVVLLFILHITLFRQPVARGALYGVFWAVPGTYLVVIATRTEAAKRRGELGDDEPPTDPDNDTET